MGARGYRERQMTEHYEKVMRGLTVWEWGNSQEPPPSCTAEEELEGVWAGRRSADRAHASECRKDLLRGASRILGVPQYRIIAGYWWADIPREVRLDEAVPAERVVKGIGETVEEVYLRQLRAVLT